MIEIRRTEEFSNWLQSLKDRQAKAKIFDRILRLADGNPGKSRSVGAGVVELKIDFGPGYRVYYVQRGEVFVLLLCGGDKSTQEKDIQIAKALAAKPMKMEEHDD